MAHYLEVEFDVSVIMTLSVDMTPCEVNFNGRQLKKPNSQKADIDLRGILCLVC